MTHAPTRLFAAIDLPAALGLLTRLPVPVDGGAATARGAASAWAYPVVGIIIGGLQAGLLVVSIRLGLPVAIAAALVLALPIVLTGALHEDGLADSADGLWGGWDKARRLAIMKDSHIGSYGVIALILVLLLRWLGLVAVASAGAAMVLVLVGALSRAAMVGVMAALPHARDGGLSRSVGRPAPRTAYLAMGIVVCVAVVAGFPILLLVGLAVAFGCGLVARAKIGGQTGDILGAVQQMTETALLITVAAQLG